MHINFSFEVKFNTKGVCMVTKDFRKYMLLKLALNHGFLSMSFFEACKPLLFVKEHIID